MATKRMWLTTEESKADAMVASAEKYGMPVSAFCGLCAWMGYKSLIRAIEPESAYTPEQMVQMYIAAKAQGLDVIEPEGEMKKLIEATKNET